MPAKKLLNVNGSPRTSVLEVSRTETQSLKHCFDQVWVINLKRRPDRLAQFWKEVEKARWPFQRPQVFSAIEGNKVGVPKFWQTGGGSYGCMRSHLALLERAIQDDVDSILVLEDDAIFLPDFAERVAAFLEHVPQDWQCLMLGGQHVNSTPFPVAPGVVRAGAGGGIQRTHCYALRGGEIMKALYRVWANAAVHCDWVMGPCTAKFNTYAPDPFLVGQSEGSSDISGGSNPPKFWRSPTGLEPVIVLQAPQAVMEGLRAHGWHAGFTRDAATGLDKGLLEIFKEPELDAGQRANRVKKWIEMIQWEVLSMTEPAICTLWHPEITAEMVRPLVKGAVVEVVAGTVEEALRQVPEEIRRSKPGLVSGEKIQAVLLRAPRAVMEVLRGEGWHTGHWRDDLTGLDNGLRKLFSSTTDRQKLAEGLGEIVLTLHGEVRQIPKGIVTLWHEDITPDLLEGSGVQVLEIAATNAHEAKLKLLEMKHEKETGRN
jgi:Glycosyltransferase family 25 (LPS biosynthesis protein)